MCEIIFEKTFLSTQLFLWILKNGIPFIATAWEGKTPYPQHTFFPLDQDTLFSFVAG